MKKISFSPVLLSILLLILYLLSFLSDMKKNKQKPVKTALVNKKYETTLSDFNFQTDNSNLFFKKIDDVWFINQSDDENFLPADSKKVQNFIQELIKVVNLYKISDNFDKSNPFFFDSKDTFTINYDKFSIFFGNYDYSQSFRYVATNSSSTIYQIESKLDKYLTTSLLAWSEPYIISRQFIEVTPEIIQSVTIQSAEGKTAKVKSTKEGFKDSIFSLMELRNGGLPSNLYTLEYTKNAPQMILDFECGDTSEIKLEIFNTSSDSEFLVKCEYFNSITKRKNVVYEKISLWTYNKIKEIML